ncbi:MAG: hypothetical protein HYR56_27805 [Acidobacteria bacterium]|nr:hypothetical protein [Acidobacteriota bacterium]MBI3425181.1 hypothetical protein [Acidobacteriota bacterium]
MTLKNKFALRLLVLGGLLIATTHDSQALRLYQLNEGESSVLSVNALAWLAGAWESQSAQGVREMQWSNPSGGMLLGFGRSVVNGNVAEFEFLRIHQTAEAVWLTIQAGRQPALNLRLTAAQEASATFTAALTSPRHAFPQRLIYHLEPDATLTVRLEGLRAGNPHCQQFTFNRVKPE